MSPAAFLHPQNASKSLAAGALLTPLLRPLAGLRRPTSKGKKWERKGWKNRKGGKEEGEKRREVR